MILSVFSGEQPGSVVALGNKRKDGFHWYKTRNTILFLWGNGQLLDDLEEMKFLFQGRTIKFNIKLSPSPSCQLFQPSHRS